MRAATRIVMPEVTGIPVGRGFAALLRRSAPPCNCARAAIALAGALNNTRKFRSQATRQRVRLAARAEGNSRLQFLHRSWSTIVP